MKRMFHITAAYASADYELTPEDLCIVKVRGEETKFLPIHEVTSNFANIPHVKGCGGIIDTYIFNTETRELNYIFKVERKPSKNDVIKNTILEYMSSRHYAKIASDMYSTNKDIEASIQEWLNDKNN